MLIKCYIKMALEYEKLTCENVERSIKCANTFDSNSFLKSEKICLVSRYKEIKMKNPNLKDHIIANELGVTIITLNKALRELNLKSERKKYHRLKYYYNEKTNTFINDQYRNYFFNVKTKKFELIPEQKTKITLTEKRNEMRDEQPKRKRIVNATGGRIKTKDEYEDEIEKSLNGYKKS